MLECRANSGHITWRHRVAYKLLMTGSYSQFYKLVSYLNILMGGKGGCVVPDTEEKQLSSCMWIESAAVERAEYVPWSPFGLDITQLHAGNSHQCLSTKEKKRTHLFGIRHLQKVGQKPCVLLYCIRNVSSVTSHRLYPTWILCCLIKEFVLQSFSLWGF